MQLLELLRSYREDTLRRLFEEQRLSLPGQRDREALAARLAEALLDPGALEDVLSSLSPFERSVLYVILFFANGPAFTEREHRAVTTELLSRVPTRKGARPFKSLQLKGLLYHFADPFQSHRGAYVVPTDLLHEICSILVRHTVERYAVPLDPGRESTPSGYDLLRHDLLALLLLAAPAGIPVTQDGELYLKAIREIQELLPPVDMADEVLSTPFWYPSRSPSQRVELLVRFACRADFLVFRSRRLELGPKAFDRLAEPTYRRFPFWMQMSEFFARESRMLRWFVAEVVRAIPDGMGLHPIRFMSWSDPFSSESWFSFDVWLKPAIAFTLWKMVYAGVLQVVRRRELPLLVPTRLGRSLLAGEESDSPAEKEMFVIEPNFEILADPKTLMRAGEDIAPFVELVAADRTFSLRFSRKSIHGALRRGLSVSSCRQALQRFATQQIPKIVLDMMQEWTRGYHEVHLRTGLLIQTETEDQAERLRCSPVFELVEEEIAPGLFWASEDDLSEVQRGLRSLGMEIRLRRAGQDWQTEKYILPRRWSDPLESVEKQNTPECCPDASLDWAEEALRRQLESYEIFPPASGTPDTGSSDTRLRPNTLQEIRHAVSTALAKCKQLRLTVIEGADEKPKTFIVEPLYWSPERGRYSFYGREPYKRERLWHIQRILRARVLEENSPDT